jgi:hypothetical protein
LQENSNFIAKTLHFESFMLTKEKVNQLTFDEQFYWNEPPTFNNNIYIKLEKMINWDKIYSNFNKFYNNTGRNSIPLKHMILFLITQINNKL